MFSRRLRQLLVPTAGSEITLVLFSDPNEKAQRLIYRISIWKRTGYVGLEFNHVTKTPTPRSELADSKRREVVFRPKLVSHFILLHRLFFQVLL